MDNTAPWPQPQVNATTKESSTFSSSLSNNNNSKPQPSNSLERKLIPQKDQALNCPRCNSTNTKFCYYNNYSLTQPRYFCKACKRYWTQGGSLRNIPVGGGSRKNKKPSSIKIKLPDLVVSSNCTNPNSKILETQDPNFGFPSSFSELNHHQKSAHINQALNVSNSLQLSAMELLTGITSTRGLMGTFMPMQISDPNSVFPAGFSLQGDFKPTLNFSLDGFGSDGLGSLQGEHQSGGIGGRIVFPFEDLKSAATTTTDSRKTADDHHQNHTSDQNGDSTGYWTGILGGAGSC